MDLWIAPRSLSVYGAKGSWRCEKSTTSHEWLKCLSFLMTGTGAIGFAFLPESERSSGLSSSDEIRYRPEAGAVTRGGGVFQVRVGSPLSPAHENEGTFANT